MCILDKMCVKVSEGYAMKKLLTVRQPVTLAAQVRFGFGLATSDSIGKLEYTASASVYYSEDEAHMFTSVDDISKILSPSIKSVKEFESTMFVSMAGTAIQCNNHFCKSPLP